MLIEANQGLLAIHCAAYALSMFFLLLLPVICAPKPCFAKLSVLQQSCMTRQSVQDMADKGARGVARLRSQNKTVTPALMVSQLITVATLHVQEEGSTQFRV